MGLCRLCFLLWLPLALALAACGDNVHHADDGGIDDGMVSVGSDGSIDAPPDALTCDANQMKCGDQCVDPQTDNDNCGACGTSCGSGTCQQGMCCAAGQTNCNGECVDLAEDETHCGSCTNACGGGETCQNGTCCGDGLTACGSQCFDVQSDETHCGDCSTACGLGESCEMGICCPTGQVNCNGTCKDPMTDETACGGCGTTCGTGEECSLGVCCTAGETSCGGTCKDLSTDEMNCGACGTTCGGSETCITDMNNMNPKCCTNGFNNCGGTCSNPLTDNNNCGGCGIQCGTGETCSDGICCGPGQTNCGGTCVDLLSDDAHCGTCSTTCSGATPVCNGGTCADSCDTAAGYSNCNGDCVNTDTDHNNCGACGTPCAANEVCASGVCTTMCGPGQMNCNGSCVDVGSDPNHCGSCTTVCALGDECVAGQCQLDCPSGETLCGGPQGTCHNLLDDELACGDCNTQCAAGEQCLSGVCCAAGEINCGGVCKNPTDDEMNCGGCGITCTTGQTCTNGTGGGKCCTDGFNNCGGTCSDPMNDNKNCGGCGIDCGAGATCDEGICCPTGQVNLGGICCLPGELNCGGTCIDPKTDPDHCGQCTIACGTNEFCDSGTCATTCNPPNNTTCGICTNTDVDPNACGASCDKCPIGADCVAGTCETCAQADPTKPDECNGACTNTDTDASNCGACNVFCGSGQTCQNGTCCGLGLTECNGQCLNLQEDDQNCGACGNACGAGESCVNGACACGFGQISCPNGCVTPSVDPLNCGSCGDICGAGANLGKPYCVSGGCTAACPAPLVGCGTGPSAECTNTDSDNDNCGSCGHKCPATQGCSNGTCVPKFPVGPDPAKCVGGGPPISVPTGGGEQTCTGNLGSTSFTFGLCSRTNVGPLSQDLFTDAFNSLEGPYKSTCTTDADCGTTGKCIGDPANGYAKTCAGGGVGINGTVGPVADNTAATHVGGDFWVFGSIGLNMKGAVTVKERFYDQAALSIFKKNRVFGDATVKGPWSSQGGGTNLQIDGALKTEASCPPLASNVLTLNGGCTTEPFPNLAQPCGTAADLIPVRDIVEYFRNPLHNDNAAIGLPYDALTNPPSEVRLELPCGYYYLDSLGGSKAVTIVVKGHTALFIGGAANINVEMIFDVEPTASLDMFVGGVVRIAHPITLGSPAYPRLTRMYIGSASTKGGGASCTTATECTSGLCSACPSSPFGPCTGTGTCVGGAGLTKAIEMSQGGFFNGLLWSGYGEFRTSNPVEMYGSIFANYVEASGALKVHYDNAAVETGDECPPPTGACESCRDCNNQACVDNQCAACTSDSQCCPPLHCDAGTCKL